MDYLKEAHKASFENEEFIKKATTCGCFQCKRIFSAKEVIDDDSFCTDKNGRTAICPYCAVDSVISDNVGYEITPEFLEAMYKRWFD